jgi:signal transduction histidine kinase
MKEVRVQPLLFLTVLVMAALPLLAALYFLNHTLQTSLNLGFNERIVSILDHGAQNLKVLRRLDPARQEEYRRQFGEIEQLQHIYANPELVKANLLRSLQIYFAGGLLGAVALSVLVALVLSRRISHAYQRNFAALMHSHARLRYLEEISSWQEMAKVLAHEIKNPLTPIEMLLSSLVRSYRRVSPQDFEVQLLQAQGMVGEELEHLKDTVQRFSEFARLPKVDAVALPVSELLHRQVIGVVETHERAAVEWSAHCPADVHARIDKVLFRHVLVNLVRNALEANPDRQVTFGVRLACDERTVRLMIANDGVPVAAAIAARMFDPYVSSKVGKDNMGLGLAIAKKIVIEHGGEIEYREQAGRPLFVVVLPRVAAASLALEQT